MAIKEIGQGSASSLELDADPGLIKNADGETVIAITADQKVGINETAPTTPLQVTGATPYITLKNSTAENTDAGCQSRLVFQDHADAQLALIEGSHSGAADDTKGKIRFITHNGSAHATAITVTDAQAVGIGTETPAKKLEVKGPSGEITARISSNNGWLDLTHDGTDAFIQNGTGGGSILFYDDAAQRAKIDSDGGFAYKPAVISHASGTLSTLAASKSATTVLLTADSSTVVQLPELTDADKGAQFVICNVHTGTLSGAVTVAGSDKFYNADNTSGYTTAQDLTTMQAKTFICFGADKWLIVW